MVAVRHVDWPLAAEYEFGAHTLCAIESAPADELGIEETFIERDELGSVPVLRGSFFIVLILSWNEPEIRCEKVVNRLAVAAVVCLRKLWKDPLGAGNILLASLVLSWNGHNFSEVVFTLNVCFCNDLERRSARLTTVTAYIDVPLLA